MLTIINPKSALDPTVPEYRCESESELPEDAPFGSIAEILTSEGLTVKMKNSQGEWVEI